MSLLLALTAAGGGGAVNYTLACAAGSYTYTGKDASLSVSHTLACDAGSYTYTGQDASFVLGRNLALDAGAYVYAGIDATLDYVPGATTVNYALACDFGTYVYTGVDATLSYSGAGVEKSNEILLRRPKKVYIRRRGNILLFDTAEQADAYIEAEEQAQEAIDKAKSRGAKKRIAARVLKDVEKPEEVISIGALERAIDAQQLPFDMVAMLKQQDYQRIAEIQRDIQRMIDEEEELLLLFT